MANKEMTKMVPLSETSVRNRLYFIRDQKVMLDYDLAQIYGYETKAFNQQVKRNIDKFDDDFMFKLAPEEWNIVLRSQNVTSRWGGSRHLPYAFTEQGIYMLMTVLKGELATRQSKALIRLFKSMKDYVTENRLFIPQKELTQLAIQVQKNASDIDKLKENMATKNDFQKVMDNFIDSNQYKHFLILNGQKIEADVAYTKIYKQAKSKVFVIDNYIGLKTLELLRAVKKDVAITIFSDNVGNRDKLTKPIFSDFLSDYPNSIITLKEIGNKVHDRYIVLDYGLITEKIYHCGASSKDAGKQITTISLISDGTVYHDMIKELLKNKALILK